MNSINEIMKFLILFLAKTKDYNTHEKGFFWEKGLFRKESDYY